MDKAIKKFWLVCLWLASLCLVGCFHVPNQDWLPNKNKIDTWNIQKDTEMQQAVDSFMEWIDIISSQRDESKKDEDKIVDTGDFENIKTWGMVNDENEAQEIENIVSE